MLPNILQSYFTKCLPTSFKYNMVNSSCDYSKSIDVMMLDAYEVDKHSQNRTYIPWIHR